MREGPSGKKFDDDWREIPDSTPRSVSVDLRPKSMEQMVAMYVSQAMALESRIKGEEGVEEAEDLEVDDEGEAEILTPYELHAMAAEVERDARRREWLAKNSRFVYRKKERVPEDGKPGSVGQGEERGAVSGAVPGGGASAVRPVEQAKEVRPGGPGGEAARADVPPIRT